jgi:tetratricopeptide (TPR) repeat protein
MRAITRLFLIAVALPAVGACSPRPVLDPRPGMATMAELSRADALVREGCYGCLQDALAAYRRLALTGGVPAAGMRAADAAYLLALRERELGLGRGTARAQADELAAALPPPADYSVIQAVADVLPWNQSGVSREQQDALLWTGRSLAEHWAEWRATLMARAPSDVLSAYLVTALDCHYEYKLREALTDRWRPPGGPVPPLLRYRQAACGQVIGDMPLEAVLKEVPRFGEAHLFLGDLAFARGTLRTAEKHYVEAAAAIPGLTAADLALGQVYFIMEDLEPAREAFHRVNEAVSGQRDAMLGEAKSLSYLGRSEDAIAILDQMEKLGTWQLGDMHYWRAWNRHRLRQLAAADADVTGARRYLPMDPQVDKLAGLVALGLNDVPRAEREFRLAVQHFEGRGGRDCDSGYYLASTLVMQRRWAEAAPIFEKAEPCYVRDEEALEKRVGEIRGSDLPEERKARLIAAKGRDKALVRLQQARACFNAAVALANLGDLDKARPFAERAAAHPDLAAQARALMDRIGKSAPSPLS